MTTSDGGIANGLYWSDASEQSLSCRFDARNAGHIIPAADGPEIFHPIQLSLSELQL